MSLYFRPYRYHLKCSRNIFRANTLFLCVLLIRDRSRLFIPYCYHAWYLVSFKAAYSWMEAAYHEQVFYYE